MANQNTNQSRAQGVNGYGVARGYPLDTSALRAKHGHKPWHHKQAVAAAKAFKRDFPQVIKVVCHNARISVTSYTVRHYAPAV